MGNDICTDVKTHLKNDKSKNNTKSCRRSTHRIELQDLSNFKNLKLDVSNIEKINEQDCINAQDLDHEAIIQETQVRYDDHEKGMKGNHTYNVICEEEPEVEIYEEKEEGLDDSRHISVCDEPIIQEIYRPNTSLEIIDEVYDVNFSECNFSECYGQQLPLEKTLEVIKEDEEYSEDETINDVPVCDEPNVITEEVQYMNLEKILDEPVQKIHEDYESEIHEPKIKEIDMEVLMEERRDSDVFFDNDSFGQGDDSVIGGRLYDEKLKTPIIWKD